MRRVDNGIIANLLHIIMLKDNLKKVVKYQITIIFVRKLNSWVTLFKYTKTLFNINNNVLIP